ncbi:MAG TPA: alanine racemase [Solirubrobacteraceae bacterium]|jgi:alanine racemase|nr:alanine racemase [Solirubrobacteraceae bacterium]
MDAISATTFAQVVHGSPPAGATLAEATIRHVTTHSRRIHSGAAFFALRGDQTDGHDFVADALQNGAALAVVAPGRVGAALAGDGRMLEVDDPLRALHRLAEWWRTQLEGRVVAIVGSNGKTITKDALVHLLADERTVYGSPGSYNSQLGVPLALLQCPRGCEVAVLELAISRPGEMANLERIVRPDCVVMTNLGSRWRAGFRDRAHHARELLSIAAGVGPDGWLLLGEDDVLDALGDDELPGCPRLVLGGAGAPLPGFGTPRYDRVGLVVQARFPDGRSGRVCVHTPSEEILADVELAAGAAWLLGLGSEALLQAAHDYAPTSTRMEVWRSPGGITLIRDVATPDPIAVGSAIRAAKRVAGGRGRTVVVLDEHLDEVDESATHALAHVLVSEAAASVYGVDGPARRRLASAVSELDRTLPVQLFEGVSELRGALLDDLEVGDVALVQSPPSAPIGDLSAELMESMAPTRLYMEMSAIEDNVSTFRRLVGPTVRLLGVVKALAYGTDSVNVAGALEAAGVDFLGVSGADEGAALRRAGVTVPILALLGTGRELRKMVRHRLTPVIYSPELLEAVLDGGAGLEEPLRVHVEVDTGMHRTGFLQSEAVEVLRRLRDAPHVQLEGLMTHFACADDPAEDEFTELQIARFEAVVQTAHELGFRDFIRHAGATAGVVRFPHAHFDMVRVGLGLYGVHPSEATRSAVELSPVLGLVSRIVEVVDVAAGERVGYGGTHEIPPGGGRLGVVPAGYHDCVPRHLSNVGSVMVAGVRCRIVGNVSMDSMVIDLSHCPGGHVGSDVLILGRHGDWRVPLEDIAGLIDTIPYELMVRIGPRVQRIFTSH